MKKNMYFVLLLGILLASDLSFAGSSFNTSAGNVVIGSSNLKIYLVNQDPEIADPGNYLEILFKIENLGTTETNNVVLELMPEYPFSFDADETGVRELGTIEGSSYDDNAYLVRYKLRVDNDAPNGDNELKLKYYDDSGITYREGTFNVSVSNPKTDFEIIVQDSSSTTTLAIANIGSNTAYSTIVKIPNQKEYTTSGTSASIVGNLNAGDYTLVSFQISSLGNLTGLPPGNFNRAAMNMTQTNKNLIVEISYTDTLGIRRTIQKEVVLSSTTSGTISRVASSQQGQLQSSNGFTYIIIGVVGIAAIVAIFKFRKKFKRRKQ